MKRIVLLSVLLGASALSVPAQDDVYFVPTKKAVREAAKAYEQSMFGDAYSGSSRSVDEYNRHGSYYQAIPGDSLTDVIDFSAEAGVYPDSTADYRLTKHMARFDDYTPSTDLYQQGYADGSRDSWYSWHSPWYYSSYYPWYDSYYDPWYWGYGDPWYYDHWYYGRWGRPYDSWYWHHPYPVGFGGGGYVYHRPTTGRGRIISSGSRGAATGRYSGYTRNGSAGSRMNGERSVSRTSGGVRSAGSNQGSVTRRSIGSSGSSSYSPSRSSSSTYTPSRSSSSSMGSRSSGGSFGGGSSMGSRSAGSSSGGSRSAGGRR
jgi:hypothetical protein